MLTAKANRCQQTTVKVANSFLSATLTPDIFKYFVKKSCNAMDENDDELLESFRDEFKCYTENELQEAMRQAREEIKDELGKIHQVLNICKYVHIKGL